MSAPLQSLKLFADFTLVYEILQFGGGWNLLNYPDAFSGSRLFRGKHQFAVLASVCVFFFPTAFPFKSPA